MEAQEIIEGLMLIDRWKPMFGNDYHVGAEHDLICAGDLNWEVPEEIKSRLMALGWEQDHKDNKWVARL